MSITKEEQAVYVLNRRPYQESSLLVDVFSLHYGRFTVIAKGAMRKGSSWSALLQPFQPLLISWSGKSSLKSLRAIDVPSTPYRLSSTYLFSGYYLNELIVKLLPENEVNESIFVAYLESLTQLADLKDIQQTLRKFEIKILEELGLLPDFKYDSFGNRIVSGSNYKLIFQQGFELVSDEDLSASSVLLLDGKVIQALGNEQTNDLAAWSRAEFSQAKKLMRCLIDDALGGQEIKSRELFKPLKFKR
jgi:DNA repair protein RecO (recombination protein O)